jgi:hypothetical protein
MPIISGKRINRIKTDIFLDMLISFFISGNDVLLHGATLESRGMVCQIVGISMMKYIVFDSIFFSEFSLKWLIIRGILMGYPNETPMFRPSFAPGG